MSSEKIMNAIGQLDDDLIADAEVKPDKKSHVTYIKYSAVAASILLFILGAFFLKNGLDEPESKHDNKLLAELETPVNTEFVQPDITDAPVLPTEIIQTEKPVSEEMVVDNESDSNRNESAYIDVITPEPIVTGTPSVSFPEENIKEPEEAKTSENPDQIEGDNENTEKDDDSLPTDIPVASETPIEENKWTEEFVVANVEQSDVTDKTVAVNFVEQLFYTSFVNSSDVNYGSRGQWWYGVKVGDVFYTQAEVNIPETYIEYFMEESILKGINRLNYESEETKAYTYKIAGVSEEAAIAVKIDEQEGYYLFANPDFRVGTFNEFVQAYNLDEYTSFNALAVYDNKGTSVYEKINNENIWRILTYGESSYVDYKKLYFEHEVSATIGMDAELYGYINVPIALYSDGYIVIYLGNINGAYYVGPDTIALVKGQIVNAK